MAKLVDMHGRPVELGEELGRGGEGTVYALRQHAQYVAKLYHRADLPPPLVAKLKALVQCGKPAVTQISAWPRGLLYDPVTRLPRGFFMPKVAGARRLHELYGTMTRRRHFPGARWDHLVMAARNTAAAFDTLHHERIVVGDVNQGNLLVDAGMCVHFIDCDSFQIQSQEFVHRCPVGTPHFTPPELQGLRMDSIDRSIDHDAFGLAVLIFHLLFVGRHPFVGRLSGETELSIEESISQRLFAFSRDRKTLAIDPPPSSLMLEDLPKSLGDLFERSFRADASRGMTRPLAREWALELDQLLRRCVRCELDSTHVYYKSRNDCPWCRIETEDGPSYFLPENRTESVWADRVYEVESAIGLQPWTVWPEFDAAKWQDPVATSPPTSTSKEPWSLGDTASCLWAAGGVVALGGIGWPPLLIVGGLLISLTAAWILYDRRSRLRRTEVRKNRATLRQLAKRMRMAGDKAFARHGEGRARCERNLARLRQAIGKFYVDGDELERMVDAYQDESRESTKAAFLNRYTIRSHATSIRGMTNSIVEMLTRYGIESAADLDPHLLFGIPGISASLHMELMHWREATMGEYHAAMGAAHRTSSSDPAWRKRAIQALRVTFGQKVVAEAKRLKVGVEESQEAVHRERRVFEFLLRDWVKTASDQARIQGQRRCLERCLNRPGVVWGSVAFGVLLVALGIFLL